MIDVAGVVGKVVADIAREALSTANPGRRPAIRITGLHLDEIVATAKSLEGFRIPGVNGEPVVKVGTHATIPSLEERYILAPGETLTRWRNADIPALIILDLDPQGDEEGLAALNRLDDLSIMGEDQGEPAGSRLKLLAKHSWEAAGHGRPLPERLLDCLDSVRISVAESKSLSLRRWTRFVAAVCSELLAVELITPDRVHSAVGGHLAIIGLFPDRQLFADDKAIRARLTRNVRVSSLSQPSGAAISEDDLLHRVERLELSRDTLEFFDVTAESVREQMMRTVERGGPSTSYSVELELWLKLFERSVDQSGLGHLIREHISVRAPERTGEFDDLEVEAGLDAGEQEPAERLLRAEPRQGEPPLAELLNRPLRRRVEKLAFPDAQSAADPLRALLHALHVLAEMEGRTVRLDREGTKADGEWSTWLFALLYGKTLLDIAERSADSERHFEVDEGLISQPRPALPPDDEEFDLNSAWAPLRLTVTVGEGSPRRFRWEPLGQPGLVAFAGLVSTKREFVGAETADDLDAFCERFLDPRSWEQIPGSSCRSNAELVRELCELRLKSLETMQHGISADALEEYETAWGDLVNRARAELVPTGSAMPQLADVVLSDVIQLGDGRLAMLAVHPLRLRWVSRHLRNMADHIVRALVDGLTLNPENPELFFDWLDRLSPHGTPPVLVGLDDYVGIASREFGWHEEYAPVRRGGSESRDWFTSVDDGAIEEMVSVIGSYLDTYPSKRDGLVLLLMNRDGSSRLPLRIMQRLRSRWGRFGVEFHVFAPRPSHHDVVRAFEDAFPDDESEEQLFADIQLVLRPWDGNAEPDLSDLLDRVDIALAPALFGTRTVLKSQTRDAEAVLSGAYDPWIHHSTHDLADQSENVRRVMLPQQSDPLLETWSTLSVRHEGQGPVAPSAPDNTDYFTLQVRFDRHQALFAALHSVAHWVITLDAFVGRDQIDHLPERPDVILVRTGVGKNQAYTLLVSSSTGRRFVVQRLRRKLGSDLGFGADLPVPEVAERFYEVGRHVVPGAVLRALGLGRAASEVVGLVASRFEVARRVPIAQTGPALEAWVSFDDHQTWFGRSQRIRADLGRFVFTIDPDTEDVQLDVLVVESKFRQTSDLGTAEQQLDRTTELCRLAFGGVSDSAADDAKFWAQELAAAVEQTSRVAVPGSELPARRLTGGAPGGLEGAVIRALRAGQVRLNEVAGVAVSIAAGVAGPAQEHRTLGEHERIQLNRPELVLIVDQLLARIDPHASTAANLATTDAGTHEGIASPGLDQPSPRSGTSGAPPAHDSELVRPSSVDREAGRREAVANVRGLGEDVLKGRYERLLDVLRQHSVAVDPPQSNLYREGPGFYVFRVIPRPGVAVDRVINRRDEVALALKLSQGQKIRTSLDRGAIAFEVPKDPSERYIVSAHILWGKRPVVTDALSVPLGEDISGETVSIDFSSPNSPHLLVAGTTGSGKSAALETLLGGLCRYSSDQVRLQLVDPKGTELQQYEEDNHLEGQIGMDAEDAVSILEAAVEEMQRRYSLMKGVRARNLVDYNRAVPADDALPWKVILLDEYADLTSDPDDKATIEQLLRRLTQKARAAGLHIIVATQRPSADVVSTTIRSNFPAQLALRVRSATDSRIIMDETGAEYLAGQGDAFLRTSRGTTRLQIALVE